jgi:hypothetical protein
MGKEKTWQYFWVCLGGQYTPMGDFDSGSFVGCGNVPYFASQIIKS